MHTALRAFLRKVRVVLWSFLDGLVLLATPSPSPLKLVLIVRLDAIGDFVLWLDAVRMLVSHYRGQGYRVVLLGNQVWASLAGEMGLADEVWALDPVRFYRNLPYRWQWLRRLRKAGFSVAIQPTYSRIFLIGDSAVRASGAPVRIGSMGDRVSGRYKPWGDPLFTQLIAASDGPMMELMRTAEFMRGLGIHDFKARMPDIPQSSAARPAELPTAPYAVLFPGASWSGREWQSAGFAEIGCRLAARGLQLVLAGGKGDRERAHDLAKRLLGKAINLAGKTSLSELAEVLRGAQIVISNETSAVHIGAAVGVPVVCIIGGGHYGRFAPYEIEVTDDKRMLPIIVAEPMPCYGCDWQCIYPRKNDEAVKCIRDISVEKVWDAVEAALAKRSEMIMGGKG